MLDILVFFFYIYIVGDRSTANAEHDPHIPKRRRLAIAEPDEAAISAAIALYFKPTCSLCPTQLRSFEQAVGHYRSAHTIERGFLECCGKKFIRRGAVVDHAMWHLDPNAFS